MGNFKNHPKKAPPQVSVQTIDRPAGQKLALERRILLDAAVAATAAEAVSQEIAIDQSIEAIGHLSATRDAYEADHKNGLGGIDFAVTGPSDESSPYEASTQEIVFIDPRVGDIASLLGEIPSGAAVVFLDPDADGVSQIAATLAQYDNIDAVHIISHGTEGELYLGQAVLNAESMQGEYADALSAIGAQLGVDGDILIYGCDFTGGDAGIEAARVLGGLTGADIASSIDDTGAAALGGDWTLENTQGTVEAQAIVAES